MKKNILIIVAHRDDETFGCGGTISKLSKNHNIFAISMTDGISSRDSYKKQDIDERKKNSMLASKILGFKWLNNYCGNFSDNQMDRYALLEVVKVIENAKKKINPEIVFTHYENDLNIDHQIVAKATMVAFRPKFKEKCKQILSFEVPSSTDYAFYKNEIFQPNCFVNIKKNFKYKLKACDIYKKEMMKYPNSRSNKGLENLANFRGEQVGFFKAEAFKLLRFLD